MKTLSKRLTYLRGKWLKLSLLTVAAFNSLIHSKTLNFGLQNVAPENQKHQSVLQCTRHFDTL